MRPVILSVSHDVQKEIWFSQAVDCFQLVDDPKINVTGSLNETLKKGGAFKRGEGRNSATGGSRLIRTRINQHRQ